MVKCPICQKEFDSEYHLNKHLAQYGKEPKHIRHNHLKAIAKRYLKDLGFDESEIFEEYAIKESQMKSVLRVDVAGIKGNKKIAIECGKTPADKIAQLNLFFDEVICLPYMNERLLKGRTTIDFLKNENKELREKFKLAIEEFWKSLEK